MNSLQLLPESASTFASELNPFFWFMVLVCGVVTFGIAVFVVYSAIRYRRKRDDELPEQIQGNYKIEATWTAIPLIIFLGMFGWGAKAYFDVEAPPAGAMKIYIVAKQWMWKAQHVDGQREINTLHVPIGRPVQLIMISQDVIHSFFVPAFRIKQDVLPDRYTTIWFNATRPGKYHLFCAEYCGTKHSGMIGWVYAMESHDYARWLTEGAAEGSLASTGEKLFHQFGCANCHHFDGHGPCPDLRGLYGRTVVLQNGASRVADDTYIRECILKKKPAPVAGFADFMPSFDGRLTEDQILALTTYIKSIGPPPGAQQPSSSGSAPKGYSTQPGIAGPGSTSIAGTEPDSR
jgi:cytochrome c oxidase subunit 2